MRSICPVRPCLYNDDSIESLKQLCDAAHAEGAKISIQLQNAGPEGNAKNAGAPIEAATAIKTKDGKDIPVEVPTEKVNPKDQFFKRAGLTKEKLAKRCPECIITVEALEDKDALKDAVNHRDIVINATIMDMKPYEDITLIDKSLLRKDLVVADTVYNPEKTKMILEAEEAGCKAIGGVGMLQQQGAVNYGLFVGKKMPLEEYRKFQAEQAK